QILIDNAAQEQRFACYQRARVLRGEPVGLVFVLAAQGKRVSLKPWHIPSQKRDDQSHPGRLLALQLCRERYPGAIGAIDPSGGATVFFGEMSHLMSDDGRKMLH